MKFFVIEGDNGTGKDTLAKMILKEKGFAILTYCDDIKELEKKAQGLKEKKRVKAFWEYNQECGNKAIAFKQPSVLIRYWVSTAAAAYADEVFTLNETLKIVEVAQMIMPKAQKIFYLKCDFNERIRRIKERNLEKQDDISIEREKRYSCIIKKIEEQCNNWVNIETTNVSIEEVLKKVSRIIDKDIK